MIEYNGYLYPSHEGQPLSWSIGLHMNDEEAENGFKKAFAVARAIRDHRPGELEHERRMLLKAQFGIFGHRAKIELDLIEAVLRENNHE
jgi:hypothetical protein